MAATAGSKYQVIALAHQAGSPPNTDYQRTNESYNQYIKRMWANELPPDINPTESDASYLTRLASYVPAPIYENISASYAIYAGTEIAPTPTSSYALAAKSASYALEAKSASYSLVAKSASYAPVEPDYSASVSSAKQNALVTGGTYTITSSWANNATNTSSYALEAKSASYSPVEPDYSRSVSSAKQNALVTGETYTVTSSWSENCSNAPANDTASYLEGGKAVLSGITGDNITITNTSGRAIDARCSTSGNTIYAQSLLSQAIYGVQSTSNLTADINVGAIAAQRSVVDMNGGQPVAAVLTVVDQYETGSAPLITAAVGSREKFKVDKNGILYSSGSAGQTVRIEVAAGVTMSFQGGLFVSSSI